jgi:predicted DNA-binding mobile mystery protein A
MDFLSFAQALTKNLDMRNKKLLALQQLDLRLEPFLGTEKVTIPSEGWISNIRNSLNITLEQLGEKLGMGKTGVKNLEERESNGTISIRYLKEVGQALNMKFVYGFVSNEGSFEKLVEAKAYALAKKIVSRTNQNMALENQAVDEKRLSQAIDELAAEIKKDVRKTIWD